MGIYNVTGFTILWLLLCIAISDQSDENDGSSQCVTHATNAHNHSSCPMLDIPSSTLITSSSSISWEFESGLDGWRYISADKRPISSHLQHTGSWITVHFQDSESYLESPRLNLYHFYTWPHPPINDDITIRDEQRWTLAVRYRFYGPYRHVIVVLQGSIEVNDPIPFNSSNTTAYTTFEKQYDLSLEGDGVWHISHLNFELDSSKGDPTAKTLSLQHVSIHPGSRQNTTSQIQSSSVDSSLFKIDWIRLLHAPVIKRVTGCSNNQYSRTSSLSNVTYDVSMSTMKINGVLQHVRTTWDRNDMRRFPYTRTYNCNRKGGENITIEGLHFSMRGQDHHGSSAHVFIDGLPCTHVRHDLNNPDEKITCITPRMNIDGQSTSIKYVFDSRVEVRNGKLPGLSDTSVTSFRYANPPPTPVDIQLSNFAARSIDISWKPGGAFHNHITYTGYTIYWRDSTSEKWSQFMAVGNVSTTTVRGLNHNSTYCFGVSGLAENQMDDSWWTDLDSYGRRSRIDGALEGPISLPECGRTLHFDVEFNSFNANSTQDYGPSDKRTSLGPTAVTSGEGHYGLRLVGDANIENCNTLSFCCDQYDVNDGCSHRSMTCRAPFFWDYNIDDAQRLLPGSGILVEPFHSVDHSLSFHSKCGPALRLTSSSRNQRGALWYPRQLEVLEGFDTNFTFRISNPSVRCRNLDEIYDYCRSRGADGLAFVIQTEGVEALGDFGHNLGYAGINNSIAVEFDSYYNFEDEDEPYENHISVHTGGKNTLNSARHRVSLGDTSSIPDLTVGNINIRIKYDPVFDESQLSKPSFIATPYLSDLLGLNREKMTSDNQVFASSQWEGKGLGMLKVYCQSLHEPVLIVPLHLGGTLNLHRGRAWVGFTASTGQDTWQTHDILNWTFMSLRLEDGN